MKKFLLICGLLFIFALGSPINVNATNIAAGNITTQTWTAAGSPYYIYGNITILNGNTLTIDPGVYVYFTGHYGLFVQGRLMVNGTSGSNIYFYSSSTTGWSGIRFYSTPTSNDTSVISYAKIIYGKANTGSANDMSGGGIACVNYSKLIIRNSTISDNYAQYYGGGLYLYNSSPILVGNLICNNQCVSYGGGISLMYSSPEIINNTIVNNNGGSISGGIDIYMSSYPTLKNCIFWGNTASSNPQIYPSNYGSITYSNIQGGNSGAGNINSDPKFINPTTAAGIGYNGFNYNWKLNSTSPSINKGSLSLSGYLPITDLGGYIRLDYDTIDMGAHEFVQSEYLCGTISSNRTLSKYVVINCDVTVANGVTLTIPAGAKVRFLGSYKLNISGRLLAVGRYDNFIMIYPASSANPWKGIRFDNTATTNDTSKIEYCVLQYSYATGSGNDIYGGAIFSNNVSKLIVRNNYITNNRAYSYGGAIACFNGTPFIVGNLIANNTSVAAYGGGIYLSGGSANVINNTITRNSATTANGNGVYVNSGTPKLRNNIIWTNNSTAISYQLYPSSLTDVQYCIIEGGTYSGTGNQNVNPLFKSTTAGSGYAYDGLSANWALQSSSTIINAGTPGTLATLKTSFNVGTFDLTGKTRAHGTIDPGAFEDVSSINVCGVIAQNTTWNANTVHVTCDVTVANGVTLTIAAGTKVVFDNYYALRIKGRLLAEGTKTDSIKFQALNPSIGWRGIRFDSIAWQYPNNNDTSKITYCRIEHGKCDGSSSIWYNSMGGGLFVYYYEKILLENTLFTNNVSTTPPTYYTTQGGAAAFSYCKFPIRNCTFTNNSVYYYGGALHLSGYKGVLENCRFSNNSSSYYGGALNIENTSEMKMINCIVVNNSTSYGGGGINLSYNSSPLLLNTTLSNNYASNYGGAIYCGSNADPVLKNCLVWNNGAGAGGNQLYLSDVNSDPKIYYSDIQGGVTAFSGSGSGANYANVYQNNLDVNPNFTTPTSSIGNGSTAAYNGLAANWTLQQGSPCINTGISNITGLGLPDYDLAGKTRVYNGRIDMGAYENQQAIYACGTISSDKVWEADTIKVTCNVLVPSGVTLTISAGTFVQFQGPYKLEVQGRLLALGNADHKITFTVKDTTYFSKIDSFNRGCWKGIQFNSIPTANDSSKLVNCIVKYGKASGSNYWMDGRGGGIYIYNSNKILISNCNISNNIACYVGSGIYIESSNPVITNNLISNNSVIPTASNYSQGSAVYFDDASADFSNNTVVNNTGEYNGGLLVQNSSSPIINNCIIYNNISVYYLNNYGISYYGDLDGYNCQPEIKNTIFTNYYSAYLYNINVVQNIFYVDPKFVSPSSGVGSKFDGVNADWTLQSTTPCLNKGTISIAGLKLPAEDLAGKQRIIGDTIDLGAYEIQIHPRFITSHPKAVTACVGTKATFTVSTSIDVAYQWQKGGNIIQGATSKTLVIDSVTQADSGYYQCILGNKDGSIVSDSAKLTVRTLPSIVTHPNPTTSACLGGSVDFTVTASGSSPLTYQWYNLNGSVSGGSNPTFNINPVVSNSASTYRSIVTNNCGTATSNGATLTINTPVSVSPLPTSNSICVGGTVSFSTLGTGTSPITYQWYKNGTAISGATSFTYQITNAQTSNAGNYYCKASNVCNTDSTNTTSLTVNSPPTITYQSVSDSVCAGQSKTFSVSASSPLTVSYQWYFNSTSNAISGATNNIYTINSVSQSNGGTYYCKATNTCGIVTTSAIDFTVKAAPAITSQTSSMSLCVGQQATFSITATGTAPITYKWYKDNVLISGAVSSSYDINAVTTANAGNYYCAITNSCGTINSTIKNLTVNTTPAITSQSAGDSVCLSQSKTFSITASGSAPITYQWYFNSTSNSIQGATNNFYTINNISASHGGLYYCKATNVCGSATTSQITLTVKTAPTITSQSSSATRCIGQSQNFNVTATGSPAPTYQWYKDDVPISGATNNTYSISVITASDAGNYHCIVSNACNYVQSNVKILTVNTPPEITYQTANSTKCSGQSITLDVTSTGTTPISYQWSHSGFPITGAVNNFYTIYNITPNDSGIYYCVATNVCGTSQSQNILLSVNLPITVHKQSRDTSKCLDDATLLSVQANGTTPIYYSWYFEDDSIAGAHDYMYYMESLKQNQSGNYHCMMTNVCGTLNGAYKELTVRPLPLVHLGNDTTFCFGGSIELSADGPYYCKWNNGSTRSYVNVTHSGTFFVHVTDPYGCKNYSDTINVTVNEPYANEALCVVTVDPATGKNLLAWERTRGYRTASYNVWKETSQTGVYLKIGSLPFDSLSVLIDTSSNPRKKADRYALTVVDSCGNESDYSFFHKSIHLTANKGTSGENNLSWNHYEGFPFNTYKIYRGSTPSNMLLLDSVASNLNSYSDLNPPSGAAYYQISAIKLDICYPDITRAQANSGPYSQSISNLKDYSQVATKYLSASPVESYIGWQDGSTAYFNVYTNVSSWDATTSSTWFNLEKDYQNNILKAVAFWNDKTEPRSDTIRITGDGVTPQDVIVSQDGTTGIIDIKPDIHLMVYPNPFSYNTTIEYDLLYDANVNIEAYNMIGERVATVVNQHQLPGKYNFTFETDGSDGIYILRMVVNNNIYIKKLIKTE